MAVYHVNQPSGRAVTRSFNLPWSSGDDFRLSLKPISAGDRGSIPRGRVSFCTSFFVHHEALCFYHSVFFCCLIWGKEGEKNPEAPFVKI